MPESRGKEKHAILQTCRPQTSELHFSSGRAGGCGAVKSMESDLNGKLCEVKDECTNARDFRALENSNGIAKASEGPSADENEDNNSFKSDEQNQLVLYDGKVEIDALGQVVQVSKSTVHEAPLPKFAPSTDSIKVLPSVGAYTAQCHLCFKWRLIPSQEKYEEIRAHSEDRPFTCKTANLWRKDISCNDPEDISPDGSRIWAIDEPGIAEAPLGWKRLLRIRGEGSYNFADVYYITPTGKRLRSMVEVDKHLQEHPEYSEGGVNRSQFSFRRPKPLQKDYVRKHPSSWTTRKFRKANHALNPVEPAIVNPLAWEAPADWPNMGSSGSGRCEQATREGASCTSEEANHKVTIKDG